MTEKKTLNRILKISFIMIFLSIAIIGIMMPYAYAAISSFDIQRLSPKDDHSQSLNQSHVMLINVYDSSTGLIYDPDDVNCSYQLYSYMEEKIVKTGTLGNSSESLTATIPGTDLLTADNLLVMITCTDTVNGGYHSYHFSVKDRMDTEAVLSLWTCPSSTQEYIIVIGISILIIFMILLAIYSGDYLYGVIGSLMMIFLYFNIGACSPILFSPLLISGILMTLLFLFS
jgi:hypothetical protein